MTRSEAEEKAKLLQAEDPDRATHRFVARPATGDDPRAGHEKRVPGFPGGIV